MRPPTGKTRCIVYLQLEIEELGGDPRSTALPQR